METRKATAALFSEEKSTEKCDNVPAWIRVRGRGGRIFVNVIPPVCILIELGQTWREGQQTIILFEHNVDCDASASGELLLKQE